MCKVTLAMPVYQVEKYIERALLSALNQTFQDLEILLVNDQGSDSSMEIVRKIVSGHPRGEKVRIVDHDQNLGLGATRNTAVDEARGEFLYFMDSDDEITPDCITTLYGYAQREPVDLVAASYYLITPNKREACAYSSPLLLKGKFCLLRHSFSNQESLYITSWNKLYKTDFLRSNKIRCVANHVNEDAWFTFQVQLAAHSCRLVDDMTYLYYINENSVTDVLSYNQEKRNRITWQNEEIVALKKEHVRQYREELFYPDLVRSLMTDSIRFAFTAITVNTMYLHKEIRTPLIRNLKRVCLAYRSPLIRGSVRKILVYPESRLFAGTARNKRRSHRFFYALSRSPYIFQLLTIIGSRIFYKGIFK